MASNKKGKAKGKYATELERLRALNAIKEVLKKGDIENAALTNTSKDSETVSDNVIENMLNQLNLNKNSAKDFEIVESLTSASGNGTRITKSTTTKIRSAKGKIKAKSKVHMVKRIKAGKAKQKKR